MLGQLSDGLGENASQRKILIGNKEVSIDFETNNEHVQDFIAIEPTKTKPKM